MIKALLAALVLATLYGCSGDPLSTTQTNNSQFQIAHLFDVESCRVYRFRDGGYSHYVTICDNANTSTSTDGSCGKGCVRHDDIQADTQSN